MLPYIITFIISTLLAYVSERKFKNERKKTGVLFLILAVIPLVFLAWVREPTLGYDMKLYGIRVFDLAKSLNYSKFKVYVSNATMESGYLWLIFFLCKIKPDINFMMLGLQLINTIAFCIIAYNYRNKCSITLAMILYETTWYLFTYNIFRQSIALSICLIMIVLLEKKKYIISIVLLIIGTYFHDSMIFAIMAVLVMWIMSSNKIALKNKILLCFFITIFATFVLAFYNNIITLAYNVGIISQKYVGKLSNSEFRSTIDIEYSLLFLKTVSLALGIGYLYSKSVPSEEKNENLKWFTMLVIDYVVTFLSFKIRNTDRITWYLYYPALFIFVPQTIKIFKKDKLNITLAYCLIGSAYILYFLEKMITNQYNICPYISNIF